VDFSPPFLTCPRVPLLGPQRYFLSPLYRLLYPLFVKNPPAGCKKRGGFGYFFFGAQRGGCVCLSNLFFYHGTVRDWDFPEGPVVFVFFFWGDPTCLLRSPEGGPWAFRRHLFVVFLCCLGFAACCLSLPGFSCQGTFFLERPVLFQDPCSLHVYFCGFKFWQLTQTGCGFRLSRWAPPPVLFSGIAQSCLRGVSVSFY